MSRIIGETQPSFSANPGHAPANVSADGKIDPWGAFVLLTGDYDPATEKVVVESDYPNGFKGGDGDTWEIAANSAVGMAAIPLGGGVGKVAIVTNLLGEAPPPGLRVRLVVVPR